MKISKSISLFLCTALSLSLASCKITSNDFIDDEETIIVDEVEINNEYSDEKVPVKEGEGLFNNLTGLCNLSASAEGKRPVAVMVNNIKASLPQYGIYNADIIYECPVEGGITRLMAIYADSTAMTDICSIRSCRYYYPIFAMGYDAVYIHCGLDKTVAADTLEKFDVDHIDGLEDDEFFARDSERLKYYDSEHTMYLSGTDVSAAISSAGIRSELSSNYDVAFDFKTENSAVSNESCTTATIHFSDEYFSTFEYDEETQKYLKFHSGEEHMDSAVNKQLEYTNIFYLETTTEVINYDNYLISLDWTGGFGYYISNGSIVEIEWSKSSETAPIKFKTIDGYPLEVNTGNSYIGISDASSLVWED